jgi:hypothetical protein
MKMLICNSHIGWHTIEGFALQFVENPEGIKSMGLIDEDVMEETCSAWTEYQNANSIDQFNDSGI